MMINQYDWFFFAVVSFIFFGLQKFAFKVIADKDHSSPIVTLYFMVTVTILSGLLFLLSGSSTQNLLTVSGIALINGILFLSMTLLRIEALKRLPSIVAFQLFGLSFLPVFLYSLIIFNEKLNYFQYFGVFLGVIVSYLLISEKKGEEKARGKFKTGVLLAVAATIVMSGFPLISKHVAISQIDTLLFITLSYFFNSFILLVTLSFNKTNRKRVFTLKNSPELKAGVVVGLLNFAAYYTRLEAFKSGSVLLVSTISGMSILIVVGMSTLLLKERLTVRRCVALLLSLIAMMLVKT